MKLSSVIFWLTASNIGIASAYSKLRAAKDLQSRSTVAPRATNRTAYYFDQAIDHFPDSDRYSKHTNETFQQRYYVETSYYKPGGPVFLYLGGEVSIEHDTHLDSSLITQFMKTFNGIGIILETRYYGTSVPFNNTTTDDLLYYTTEQAIADHYEFARNVKLPGVDDINAPKVPWITYGGSYPGGLSAFTVKTYGDTFFAGFASSAVIHAQLEYPDWYAPIQLLAPQDCVAAVNDIVDKMDSLVDAQNDDAIQELKQIFGLEALTDIRDFAQTIAFPIGGPFEYPTETWQEIYWNPKYGREDFFNFCRNVTDGDAPDNVAAVDNQLAQYTNGEPWKHLGNYAEYIKKEVIPLCASGDLNSNDCFGTQNASWWANPTPGAERTYLYGTCTEMAAYQKGAPAGEKSLLSRVIDANYTQQWCNWAFPPGQYNSIPATPDLDKWNSYGSFNLTAERLFLLDGSADPWRNLCYHSTNAPQRYWSDDYPQHLINGAGHVWDLRTYDDLTTEPQFIRETGLLQIRTVARWLKEFPDWHPY